MSARHYYRDAEGGVTEILKVRALTQDATVNAEEASVGVWQFDIDDPVGTFDIGGHRLVALQEDDIADADDQYLAIGYTQQRTISRGDLVEAISTAGRVIAVDVADLNTILGRRVLTGEDANRPAETDVERMQWAVLTNEAALIDDDRYLTDANPVDMDACDYRGQYLLNVLEDCAEASGKNYFLGWVGDDAATFDPETDPWGAFFIFYDFASSETYSSTARLTNVAADVDEDGDPPTFVVVSADLIVDPQNVYSGIYATGDELADYDQDTDTATAFARRDMIANYPNVKTAPKLAARITRHLADLDEENLRLRIVWRMRPEDAHLIRHGMRVQMQFSHLVPEVGEGYVWARNLGLRMTQGEEEGFAFWEFSGDFSVETPAFTCPEGEYEITPSQHFAPLGSGTSDAEGLVYYGQAGIPTFSPLPNNAGFLGFASYGGPDGPDLAGDCTLSAIYFVLVGPGTLTIETAGTSALGIEYTLWHEVGGVASTELQNSVSTGDPIVVTVAGDEADNCLHVVRLADGPGEPCGGAWGWSGADWVSVS